MNDMTRRDAIRTPGLGAAGVVAGNRVAQHRALVAEWARQSDDKQVTEYLHDT